MIVILVVKLMHVYISEDTQTVIEEVTERVLHEKYRTLSDAFHSAAQRYTIF